MSMRQLTSRSFGFSFRSLVGAYERPERCLRHAVRVGGAFLLVFLMVFSVPLFAVAQLAPGVTPFGVNAGGTRYANGSNHSYRSAETSIFQRFRWEHRFDGAGGQDVYNKTDLTLNRAPSVQVIPDIYWLVEGLAGDIAGTYQCVVPQSDTVCTIGRIAIADDAHELSALLQNNLVCHELGHSIGFGHGTTRDSCMTGGDNNKLSVIEQGLINRQY